MVGEWLGRYGNSACLMVGVFLTVPCWISVVCALWLVIDCSWDLVVWGQPCLAFVLAVSCGCHPTCFELPLCLIMVCHLVASVLVSVG